MNTTERLGPDARAQVIPGHLTIPFAVYQKARVAVATRRFAAFVTPYEIACRTLTLKDPDCIILHAHGEGVYPELVGGVRAQKENRRSL